MDVELIVGSLLIDLHLPTAASLKEKRSVVKSVLQRLRNEFNVSTAEVGNQDLWQSAQLGVACAASDARYARQQLDAVVEWIYTNRPDVVVSGIQIEIL